MLCALKAKLESPTIAGFEDHEEETASETIEMDEDARRQQILNELEVVPDSMKATKEVN